MLKVKLSINPIQYTNDMYFINKDVDFVSWLLYKIQD